MRKAALLAVFVACGGGSSTPHTFTDTSEPAAGGREAPGPGREPGASGPEATPPGRDAPPPSQDPPPGGGSGGTTTECFPCQNLSCTGTVGGQRVNNISIQVESKDGQCVTEGVQQQVFVFACSRKITTSQGTAVGTWATSPAGITVTIDNDQLSCVPQRATPGGGGNGRDAG